MNKWKTKRMKGNKEEKENRRENGGEELKNKQKMKGLKGKVGPVLN
jgi:hypothetical protein